MALPVTSTFTVPQDFGGLGKTFRQLSQPGVLSGYGGQFVNGFGVGENRVDIGLDTPLTAGTTLRYTTDDPTYQGGGEYQGLVKAFGAPLTPQQIAQNIQQQTTNAALESAKQLRQFNLESTAPQVTQLEKGATDLKSKYAEVLASIKGTEQAATEKATLNTSNELARRGITGGGFYDTQTSNAALDIARQFAPQKAEVGLKEAESVNQINNAIAALKSGDPQAAIQAALTLSNLGQQASQFQQSFGLQQQEQTQQADYQNRALQQAMEIAKLQNQPKVEKDDITKNFATLGEGQTLFNLLTGKSLFTAPKTYKQEVSGSGSNSGW